VRANASRAPRKSKRNRNLPGNVTARGRQTCRRRESLGTDSRVLRLIRRFDTPQNAFRAKFFLRCEVGCAGVSCAKKFAAGDRARVEFSRRNEIYDSAETLNSSAFMRCMLFCAENIAREKLVAAASRRQCGRTSAANAGRASYTQNLVE
jgi:hypothetical protein